MIRHSPEVLDLLDRGLADIRGLIRFDFGTGSHGFIRARSKLSWGGLDYHPGAAIQVSDLPSAVGMQAQQFTIRLSASEEDGLTPDVLKRIEEEDYRDRPVRIYDAYFHPDTGALLEVKGLRRGYLDVIEHEDDEQDGYTLLASCETRALDYTRTNGRLRSDEDQQRRIASLRVKLGIVRDRILEHASLRGRLEVLWGRLTKR